MIKYFPEIIILKIIKILLCDFLKIFYFFICYLINVYNHDRNIDRFHIRKYILRNADPCDYLHNYFMSEMLSKLCRIISIIDIKFIDIHSKNNATDIIFLIYFFNM